MSDSLGAHRDVQTAILLEQDLLRKRKIRCNLSYFEDYRGLVTID